jgi:hypothetical protein
MKSSETTGAPSVQSVQCCVVFDSSDGEIHQIHEVVTLEGAEAVSDNEVEQRALSLAAERGLDSSTLKAIHVAPEELDPSRRYAVDPDKLALVDLDSGPSYGGQAGV